MLCVPALREDGTTISVEFTIYPMNHNGRMIGIATIMRDVTKHLNETRALKRKLKEVEKLTLGSLGWNERSHSCNSRR